MGVMGSMYQLTVFKNNSEYHSQNLSLVTMYDIFFGLAVDPPTSFYKTKTKRFLFAIGPSPLSYLSAKVCIVFAFSPINLEFSSTAKIFASYTYVELQICFVIIHHIYCV
jgi:hypothetical protein